jgi:hypothetical protein
VQPQGELTLLLLLHTTLRLLRVILSSAKERWLLASSHCGEQEDGGWGTGSAHRVSYEEELSMDVVTSEYERVTSILFHALPDLIRNLRGAYDAEYAGAATPPGPAGDGDPCVVFVDDYYHHLALLDIELTHQVDRGSSRCYGEGAMVISRRRLVRDVLEMVLEFFSLTGQLDLLGSTNIALPGQSKTSTSIHAAAAALLEEYSGGRGRAAGLACCCPESKAKAKDPIARASGDGSDRIASPRPAPSVKVSNASEGSSDDDDEDEI